MSNGFDILTGVGLNQAIRPERSASGPAKDENKRESYRKVAEEMESLFAYQLLKIMRQTSEGLSDEKKSMGYNTYMGMFDMEISRMLSERGMGLQDAILQYLQRMPDGGQGDNKK